jgi:hypothetical protein
MKNQLLFPHRFQKIGWLLFVPSIIVGILLIINNAFIENLFSFKMTSFAFINAPFLSKSTYFTFINQDFLDELVSSTLLIGALLIVFSKEKVEDEFIAKLRLDALLWSVLINYTIIFVGILTIYGSVFFTFLVVNLFTCLFLYIIRFNYLYRKYSKA